MNEKAKTKAERFNHIAGLCELSDIRVVSLRASSDPPEHIQSTGEIDLTIKSYLHDLKENKGKKVALVSRCSINLEGKEDRSFSFSAEMELVYTLPNLDAEDADFEPFVEHNVPFNAWPFFRELVQNISIRMNIPPIVLPLMKS